MIPWNIPLFMSQNRPPPVSRYRKLGSTPVNRLVGALMEPLELVGPEQSQGWRARTMGAPTPLLAWLESSFAWSFPPWALIMSLRCVGPSWIREWAFPYSFLCFALGQM
jgi:hypothetical protein